MVITLDITTYEKLKNQRGSHSGFLEDNNVVDVFISKEVLEVLGVEEEKEYQRLFHSFYSGFGLFKGVNLMLPDMTNIQDEAFSDCDLLKSVSIPKSITKIGNRAFAGCRNLESVNFSGDKIEEIQDEAFMYCESLKEVVIPESVTTMGKHVFSACNFESVTLSKSLKSISDGAFHYCDKLRSIDIPEGVTKIEKEAFLHCISLQSVVLPQSLQEIENDAFGECTSLISILFPTTLTTLHDSAFRGCCRLENFLIPTDCNYNPMKLRCFSISGHDFESELDKVLDSHNSQFLRDRFNYMPIHQICNKPTIKLEELDEAIQTDIPLVRKLVYLGISALDRLDMNALHVLSCNPNATLDMIRSLVSKCPGAAYAETVNNSLPVDFYLVTRNIVRMNVGNDDPGLDYDEMRSIRDMFLALEFGNIHDLIKYSSIDNKMKDILLAFHGTSLLEEIHVCDRNTGFLPFMTAATESNQSLQDVYELAMMTNPCHMKKREKKRERME